MTQKNRQNLEVLALGAKPSAKIGNCSSVVITQQLLRLALYEFNCPLSAMPITFWHPRPQDSTAPLATNKPAALGWAQTNAIEVSRSLQCTQNRKSKTYPPMVGVCRSHLANSPFSIPTHTWQPHTTSAAQSIAKQQSILVVRAVTLTGKGIASNRQQRGWSTPTPRFPTKL